MNLKGQTKDLQAQHTNMNQYSCNSFVHHIYLHGHFSIIYIMDYQDACQSCILNDKNFMYMRTFL
jgi:hypothetical protein